MEDSGYHLYDNLNISINYYRRQVHSQEQFQFLLTKFCYMIFSLYM
ncbi:protein of unknown function [Xenorhabdus poinarii G6]|uniref:Uncharacterized protein n=1 Tax=Xenorhabdus poinarii G6 TaxID=1354304 RepID=A0A068R174_9GAMM|nr:protein of unknown function [Xenorhabdus poinarii G6]